MISDEAVEAAKKIAYERYGSKPDTTYIRTILNAAAPYIAAEAWDRAAASIVDEHGNPIIPDSNTNPYRSQA